MSEKTHYRKAFKSPYLSAADVVEPLQLTVERVVLERDQTEKTKDSFNTAYWREKTIRPGEPLKPMILNATNSKTMSDLTGSKFIEDWAGAIVTVYTDPSVKFGRETVEGLRISPVAVRPKPELTPDNEVAFGRAVERFKKDGNLSEVEKHMSISDDVKIMIRDAAK